MKHLEVRLVIQICSGLLGLVLGVHCHIFYRENLVVADFCVMVTKQQEKIQTASITSPGSYWPLRRSSVIGRCSLLILFLMACLMRMRKR